MLCSDKVMIFVAELVAYLMSDLGGIICGHTVIVDVEYKEVNN